MEQQEPDFAAFESQFSFEDGLTEAMDAVLAVISIVRPDVPEAVLRSKIVANNLRSMSNILLVADDPNSGVGFKLKPLILSLLTVADWLEPNGEAFNAQ